MNCLDIEPAGSDIGSGFGPVDAEDVDEGMHIAWIDKENNILITSNVQMGHPLAPNDLVHAILQTTVEDNLPSWNGDTPETK